MPQNNKITTIIILSLLTSGCATLPLMSRHKASEIAKAWANQTASLEIVNAYLKDDDEIYIKYKAYLRDTDQSRIFFTKAHWDSEKAPFIDLTRPVFIPLEVLDKNEWDKDVKGLIPIKSLPVSQWERYQDVLARAMAPKEKNTANMVSSAGEDILFYYDAKGNVKITGIDKKPKGVIVNKTYDQKEFAGLMYASLTKFLRSNRIKDRRVLFVKKGPNYGSVIFYVDLGDKLSLTLKVYPKGWRNKNDDLLNKTWKTADHLILDSHVLGLARTPVSSLFDLFVKSRNTAYNVIKTYAPNIFNGKTDGYYDGSPMDLVSFEKKLDSMTHKKPYKGIMAFLVGGDEFFPQLVDALENAKDSIQIRIFIFDRDDYAVKIADILKRKSNEGVDVKVLLDGIGQIMGEGKTPETLPPGFIQPPNIMSYLKKDSKIKIRVRPNTWFKADHTKTIVIDNEVCFTGGMNIGREYRYDWHDLMVKLKGPVLKKINQEFKLAWAHSGPLGDIGYFLKRAFHGRERVKGQGYDIRLLFTRVNDPQIYKAQLLAIREAKKYIYISNAYFSDSTILNELINARKRGVDVRVILPIHGNHKIMNANNVVMANTMFKNGIKVYFYPGMSHIKAAIYDGWLCTGSANFDRLSLVENLELDVATSDKETVDRFKKVLFQEDFKRSKLMNKPLESGWGKWLANILANQL